MQENILNLFLSYIAPTPSTEQAVEGEEEITLETEPEVCVTCIAYMSMRFSGAKVDEKF